MDRGLVNVYKEGTTTIIRASSNRHEERVHGGKFIERAVVGGEVQGLGGGVRVLLRSACLSHFTIDHAHAFQDGAGRGEGGWARGGRRNLYSFT